MTLDALTIELQLTIIGFLELSSLINLRMTARYWHQLINDSLGQKNILSPSRAKLLKLYLRLHQYESFKASRPFIMPKTRPFSRTGYVQYLRAKIASCGGARRLPADFETWILEWPESAVIGWTWPGLDNEFDMDVGPRDPEAIHSCEPEEHWWRTYGANLLRQPDSDTDDSIATALTRKSRPVLLIQDHRCCMRTDLILDTNSEHDGQVWCEYVDDDDDPDMRVETIPDWTAWLSRELTLIEQQFSPPDGRDSPAESGA